MHILIMQAQCLASSPTNKVILKSGIPAYRQVGQEDLYDSPIKIDQTLQKGGKKPFFYSFLKLAQCTFWKWTGTVVVS